MTPTLNKHGDTLCAYCGKLHRRRGWFCSTECDDAELTLRHVWLRLAIALNAAARAARRPA